MLILVLALVMSLSYSACRADNSMPSSASSKMPTEISTQQANSMKINIKVGDKVVTATLIDNPTAQDFISLLPLTLTMNDLFGREKFARLPRAISGEGERTKTYEVGDIIYWSPGPDVAIFYRHDGQQIPSPGLIVIGKIDAGVEAFNVPSSINVTVELIQ
ncbi:cyclophilin-like fold protein [Scytonema sp. HK-05]|uniref:cyclophilin-like fold protein n=1 Tax=Scytonema sp. HK-05 TaxID=1137095 RepID=UPI001E348B74|nr:cyclophilin-like fold protein [Scytonema sp. HK-05]